MIPILAIRLRLASSSVATYLSMSAGVIGIGLTASCRSFCCSRLNSRSPDAAQRNPGTIARLQCRSRIALRCIRATKKEIREAERRETHGSMIRTLARADSAPAGAPASRRSTAVLARGSARPQGSASGHVSCDLAGAFGPVSPPQPGGGDHRLLHGRYPRRPVPVQRSTSRAGRIAGRHDAQAARERG